MGAVFSAVDLASGAQVAIKSLKASRGAAIERFLREGEALRVLDHPNIVKMLDLFKEGDRDYLVM
jgi:serine/threonine protein kinase